MSFVHPSENSYAIDTESTAEMVRLLEQDLILTRHMGGLFPADLDLSTVHDILDIASGSGGWVQEVAVAYPDKQVTGTDISQSMLSFARTRASVAGLENARFQFMDATSSFPFPDTCFDLVNARLLAGFMWKEAWPKLVAECVRVTRPGGLIRLVETDTASVGVTNSVALERINRLIMRASYRTGRSFFPAEDGNHIALTPMLRLFLQKAGCQQIRQVCHMIDYTAHTREHDAIAKNVRVIATLIQPFLLKTGVATREELEQLFQQMEEELASEQFCGIWYFMSCYGAKPAES